MTSTIAILVTTLLFAGGIGYMFSMLRMSDGLPIKRTRREGSIT